MPIDDNRSASKKDLYYIIKFNCIKCLQKVPTFFSSHKFFDFLRNRNVVYIYQEAVEVVVIVFRQSDELSVYI